ncbi:uncharacterized protein LOC118419141 [Branchiostoma floridae]|uniref:Uncharacterized protein LOC118419141 n=1 Tax=Branchiostoma floridae TaxID=7739 RepID=A0A9J7LGN1_BRAFL|nr:uncharacterized protein LOC118419141 [Branchiostoma floridae]
MCCSEFGSCGGSYKYNLGWALIVLGVVGFILAVIADGVYAGYPFAGVHHISAPIWGGIFIIVAGGLAVRGEKSPDNACLSIALLVMSIFGIIAAFGIFVIAAAGQGIDGIRCDQFVSGPCDRDGGTPHEIDGQIIYTHRCSDYWSDNWYDLFPDWRSVNCWGVRILHILQILLGLAETVLMFIVSVRTCRGACRNCCDGTQQPPTHAIVYQPPGERLAQQVHYGEIIVQTAPGGQPYAGQQRAQPGPYPTLAVPPPPVSEPPPYNMTDDQKI